MLEKRGSYNHNGEEWRIVITKNEMVVSCKDLGWEDVILEHEHMKNEISRMRLILNNSLDEENYPLSAWEIDEEKMKFLIGLFERYLYGSITEENGENGSLMHQIFE